MVKLLRFEYVVKGTHFTNLLFVYVAAGVVKCRRYCVLLWCMQGYDPKVIEPKWQDRWHSEDLFAPTESTPRKKMYILDMFPYPSGDGLHVGHAKIYTASDVLSRYLRMKGFNVLHPTGWDAFGLPTENTAIKRGIHPAELTKQNIDRFRRQMQHLGLSYDREREINTTDPEYYKWTQWIFLQLFRMGLAYQDTAPINWCPSCKTGLANEEVVDGECERCGTKVEMRQMRQWMLRITKYADQLLKGIGGLDWPQFIKELQQNWIGRSSGAEIVFDVVGSSETIRVFTTRVDTLFGATYIVLSPNHPLAREVVSDECVKEVEKYIQESQKSVRVDIEATKEKTGVFTGGHAVNPVNGEEVPIWIADYVLMEYGAGAIMAVPAHDERDYAFAKKYDLPIKQVIVPKTASDEVDLPYVGSGVLIHSGGYDGQPSDRAIKGISESLQMKGRAQLKVNYRMRDWVFSRQRYWGEPIPIIHCEKCGAVPVPEKDLPVELPQVEKYEPTGTGDSPLAAVEDWVNVKCPMCPRMGKRETNTMPQWAGSSWYWLRYLDPHNSEEIAGSEKMKRWLPVDLYIGGAEHAVLHLLYARFWHKVLFDAGVVPQDEPFKRFRAVGLVMGEDGQKMSKSRGNVINPDDVVDEYGADTLRVYEMFMGPFDGSVAWNTDGIRGARRFLDRVWSVVNSHVQSSAQDSDGVELAFHKTIKRVSESTEQLRFNTAISSMMEFLNVIEKQASVSLSTLKGFVLLLAPYAPHIAEELWEILGHGQSLVYQPWPKYDDVIVGSADVNIPVQVNGKVRGELAIAPGVSKDEVERRSKEIPNIAKYLDGNEVSNVVFVPDKLINFVLKC